LMHDAEPQVVRRVTDDREIEPPLAEDCLGFLPHLGLQHHEHSLLAFRQHHLISRHVLFAHRNIVEVEQDAEVALRAHFHGRAGKAGSTHVLDGNYRAGCHKLQAGFQQTLLGEWIAHLDGRALLLDVFIELGGSHGCAADTVAASLCSEIDDWKADAFGLRIEDRVRLGEARRKRVDQNIAVVARVEINLTADRRYAERVAIAADAGDDAGDEVSRLRMARLAATQRIHGSDRARRHGTHVAQDAADARCRTLIGRDTRRVVVALHLEDNALAMTDIDRAGIFARALNSLWSGSWKRAQ